MVAKIADFYENTEFSYWENFCFIIIDVIVEKCYVYEGRRRFFFYIFFLVIDRKFFTL